MAPRLTAEQRAAEVDPRVARNWRAHVTAARTEYISRLSRGALRLLAAEQPESALTRDLRAQRPRTRGECEGGERPCPWVSCRYHLAIDVDERSGSIKHNFPDLDLDEMPESCALDVADRGVAQLEQVGEILNITRERVRQLEILSLDAMVDSPLRDHADSPDEAQIRERAEAIERARKALKDLGQRANEKRKESKT